MKSFLGNFYGHLAIFSGHTDGKPLTPFNQTAQWNTLTDKEADKQIDRKVDKQTYRLKDWGLFFQMWSGDYGLDSVQEKRH